MADNEVKIKISGDSEEFKQATGEASKSLSSMEDKLNSMAKYGAVAFTALSAGIGFAVKGFLEGEQSSRKLEQALQNQGIYSKTLINDYKNQANELKKLTGIDDDRITNAQSTLQTYLGETKVTKDLTLAVANLAAAKGIDLNQAANLLGKSIANSTDGLKKFGINVEDSTNKNERMANVIKTVNGVFGDQAKLAGEGIGEFGKLKNAVEDLSKAIGEKFAPYLIKAAQYLTDLINKASENKALISLAAGVLAAGAALTGIISVIGTAGSAIISLKSILTALNLTMSLTKLAAIGLAGATGIGLLVVAVTYVATHWNTVFPRLKAIATGFVTSTSAIFNGLSKIIKSAMSLDTNGIKEGWAEITTGVTTGWNQAWEKVADEKPAEAATKKDLDAVKEVEKEQNKFLKQMADERHAEEKRIEELKLSEKKVNQQIERLKEKDQSDYLISLKKQQLDLIKQLQETSNKNEISELENKYETIKNLENEAYISMEEKQNLSNEIKLMQLQGYDKELISLHEEELALIDQREIEKNDVIKQALTDRINEIRRLETEYQTSSKEQQTLFDNEMLAKNKEYQDNLETTKSESFKKQSEDLKKSLLTDKTAKEQYILESIKQDVAANNKFLLQKQKYGVAYAEIDKAMHNEIYTGTKSAMGDLAAMQESEFGVLKAIGQAAAIANIGMKTAESAMNVFAGFSTIPFVGVGLGIAAAAAVTAFGAEQIANVIKAATAVTPTVSSPTKMANGGLVTGGIYGVDSVPIMAQQGELITPVANFDEVIGSVRASREAEKYGNSYNNKQNGIVVGFDGLEASRVLTIRQVEQEALGISIRG